MWNSWSFTLGLLVSSVSWVAMLAVAKRTRQRGPLASTVIRYEGALEGKKMRVRFELGDGSEHSMLIDRHVAQKMSDDLLIGVARIDTNKTGEASP